MKKVKKQTKKQQKKSKTGIACPSVFKVDPPLKQSMEPMTNNALEIVAVIDRSGSMSSIVDGAIGGFNQFLETQQKEKGKTFMTRVQFDDVYEVIDEGKEVSMVAPYTVETYIPRGWTALFDAVGKAINSVADRHSKMAPKDRPRVLVVILTDGHENASKEYKREDIVSLIKDNTKNGWKFVYLGVGDDKMQAEMFTSTIGISAGRTYIVSHTAGGMSVGYAAMSTCADLARYDADEEAYRLVDMKEDLTKKDGTDDE